MTRELPIYTPPDAAHRHGSGGLLPSIALGGVLDPADADDAAPGGGADDLAPGAAGRRHPDWLKAKIASGDRYQDLRRLMRTQNLNTVCEEARCPNVGECWDQRTATVMILGDVCTRACGFCAIKTGRPTWFDDDEPRRVAEAVAALGLEHVVVTSVARDDLPDGGAGAFAETIRQLRATSPGMGVEVLIPDFDGQEGPLRTVMVAGPDILNHNVETVERLQKPVRRRARYDRSLSVLERAKAYAPGSRPGRAHEELDHGGPRRGASGALDDVPRPACRGLRHPHDRPVPSPDPRAPAPGPLLHPARVRGDEGRGRWSSASGTSSPGRWSAPATTPGTRSPARSCARCAARPRSTPPAG